MLETCSSDFLLLAEDFFHSLEAHSFLHLILHSQNSPLDIQFAYQRHYTALVPPSESLWQLEPNWKWEAWHLDLV